MLLKDIYSLCIELGKKYDPRPKEEVEKYLARTQKNYAEMKEEEQEYYDKERLNNPYSDTRILNGDLELDVKKILAGIDIETSEILLADRLREKGEKVDLILAHHPEGRALAGLYQVMHLQEDILAELGVPINVAEGLLSSRVSEVERGLLPLNHNRSVDAAKLLNFPFMCVHTPADNMVNTYLENLFQDKQPETVNDIITVLKELPEYKMALANGTGPKIVAGKKNRRTGKIMIDMTGGTSGSDDAYAKLSAAGVGTIVGMHMGEKHRKEAEKNHINVVIAGHMSSDSLGMNLLLDELEAKGLEVLPCSGLTRVKRK